MKEKVEKMLKSALKRKLTITTATLISFLLTTNIAMAEPDSSPFFKVWNNKIERDYFGALEEATENLKNMGLFKIGDSTIENRFKYSPDFKLLSEVNKTLINKGRIYDLRNEGMGTIENMGAIENKFHSIAESSINNSGYINNIRESHGDIFNKAYIEIIQSRDTFNKEIIIENKGYIYNLYGDKKLKNYGCTFGIYIEKTENYGIIRFGDTNDYNALNIAGKIDNKGIVINDLSNFASNSTDDEGREIRNYKNQAIPVTEIDREILNAYRGTIDKNLTVKNNSILNIAVGTIEADKKLSFNNSTANIDVDFKNGIKLEFKNNSSIGYLSLSPSNPIDKLKSLTMDNTTTVGRINIKGNIELIDLVSNEDIVNKDEVLIIPKFETEVEKEVNTRIATNVDLLGKASIGNIIVEGGGKLTIGAGSLSDNGRNQVGGVYKYYKKDITIVGNGKILIGISPYNISEIKELGAGNNLTDSIKGQVDTTDPSRRLAQSELNIDADSLLHDIVILPEYSVTYEGLGTQQVRNKYKVVEQLDLPTPPVTPQPVWDYVYLNAVYRSLYEAGKVKGFSVYNKEELQGLYEYLRDIYANNPYTVTTETSFRNLSMFRDSAYLDLKPNLNKWAVMGGLSHSDRENKYKLSSTEVDTKTTGAYAKGEYGLKEDTTLGLILGGTNSKSELSTGKAKGSSIYLGAYAKKYVNNFKFTLGTGMDFGEYKVDRNAVGYAGIIETSKQSAKQKNRAFDLYAEARYSKDLGNNFYLEPNFNLAYSRVKRGGVTENDGKVNLNIKSKTFKQTTAEIGLDLKKVLLNGNTSHNFVLGASYQRALSGAKDSTARANVVGGGEFDILVPAREKGRASMGAEYSLENKVGVLFNLKVDYGFNHGSDKKDIRFSTGLGYKF